MHISPNQHSLIVAIRDGAIVWLSTEGHAWIGRPGFPRCTSSIMALERKGYVERYDENLSDCKFRLTEKAKELK